MAMEEVFDYTRTDTAWHCREGFIPVIEVRGRDSAGKLYKGHEHVSRSGFHIRKEDAIAVAQRTPIKSVVLDGDDLRIRL